MLWLAPHVRRSTRASPAGHLPPALSARAADLGSAEGHRAGGGRAPRGHRRGGDRLWKDDPAPQDCAGHGPRGQEGHRCHAAAAHRGDERSRARRERDRKPPRHRRRLPDPLRGPHVGLHVREVHDRRDPPRGDPRRQAAPSVRHDHPRRGPRAKRHDRLSPRLAEAHPAREAGPQGGRQLGDPRDVAVLRLLRRGAHHRGGGPHLSRGRPLRAAAERPRSARSGRPRRRERDVPRSARRHPRVSARRARDPRDRAGAALEGPEAHPSSSLSTRGSRQATRPRSSRASPRGASFSRRTSRRRR